MVDVAGSIGSVVSPVVHVGQWLATPIWRQFKYLLNYKTNFDTVQKQVDKLKKTRYRVQCKVTDAEKNVQEIEQEVKDWLKDVEKTITEAEQLIQEKANNPRCFKGFCPNFISHYKQSKKAFKLKREDIDPLLQQERELGPVSNPSNAREIWLRTGEDYLTFESRNSTMKNVWVALNDENVYMIGVYGMGGLGKTTLVQELGRKAKKEKLFEEIVFVEVSESPDIKKIQTKIADKLKMKFENESEMANKIYSRLEDKNILLILDNIWKPLELDKMVGIPCGADRGRNKLLFTTRNVDVLERMGSTTNFGIGFLNEDEAWTLFTKMAGNVIQTRELYSLPNDVCKECRGLPIVICTIAKALKNKRYPSDWKVALQELRAPTLTKFTGFLEDEYMKIALSYKYLSDELKKTFLISSLLENNTSIPDLFRHVVCLDILEGANLTMEKARDRLDKLVRNLKDACLLLDGLRSEQFAMHDVVRVVAITIAHVDHHVFTARNDVEREWKDKDKLKKCTQISLSGNSHIISQLWPNDLDCPNLEYFYMTNMWKSSFKIPKSFFQVMPKLKVLILVKLQHSSLPSSIDLLTNLQTLCLDDSKIKDVAIVGKLKKLKVLSLRHTWIEEFHKELGQLTQLRWLDLSNCGRLNVIAPNVISQLSQLEEFYIKECPVKWRYEVLRELKLLSNLTSLELDIGDKNVLPKEFFSKELKRYKISIGNFNSNFLSSIEGWFKYQSIHMENEILRILQFEFNSTISLEELCEIKNVEVLRLIKSSDGENNLEASEVNLQSNEIKPLFNKKAIFTNLMALELINFSFGKIWESQLSTSSYENLTRLILDRCDKIKYVFPFFIAKSLQQLQNLEIRYCKVLEKIVEEEEGTEVASSIFPQLTQLKFRDLPKVRVFYQGVHALKLPMLKRLDIINCPNFTLRYQSFQDNNEEGEFQVSESKSICLEHKINSDLEDIRLRDGREICWWSNSKTLYISYTNISVGLLQRFYNLEVLCVFSNYRLMSLLPFSDYFQNLKILKISYCYKLIKRLITPSMAKSLVQLREMKIKDCGMLTEIVENEGDEIITEIVFNNLNKLSLENLYCLTCFCSGNYSFNFPSLEELTINRCPNMKTFSSGSLSTPKLRNVHCKMELVMSWEAEKKLEDIRKNGLNTIIQEAHKKRHSSDLDINQVSSGKEEDWNLTASMEDEEESSNV